MNFNQLLKEIRGVKNGYPRGKIFPKTLKLDENLWFQISKMYRKTDITGLEYETSVVDIDEDLVFTPYFEGTEKRVKPRNKIQLQYKPYRDNVMQKIVNINAETVLNKKVKASSVSKSPTIKHLFSVHTHPTHINFQNEKTYSFFSPTDMRSFLASSNSLMGLVTDKLWLVFKTDKVIKKVGQNGELMLQRVSQEAFHGNKYLDDIIQKEMERWGMIFYRGEIGNILQKVN